MTKKDYIRIAEAVREIDNLYRVQGGKKAQREREAIAEVVDNLCGALYRDNPNFRAHTFKAACGVTS
jgi:hypothetical protein